MKQVWQALHACFYLSFFVSVVTLCDIFYSRFKRIFSLKVLSYFLTYQKMVTFWTYAGESGTKVLPH